jgi:hypothetical protein
VQKVFSGVDAQGIAARVESIPSLPGHRPGRRKDTKTATLSDQLADSLSGIRPSGNDSLQIRFAPLRFAGFESNFNRAQTPVDQILRTEDRDGLPGKVA